jgi:hypothetical protein
MPLGGGVVDQCLWQQQAGALRLEAGGQQRREAVGDERARCRGRLLGQWRSQRLLPLLGGTGHAAEEPGGVGGELQAEALDRFGDRIDLRVRSTVLAGGPLQRAEVAVLR